MNTSLKVSLHSEVNKRLKEGIPVEFNSEVDTELFEGYFSFNEQKGQSERTIYHNLKFVIKFIRWLEQRGKDITQADEIDAIEYMDICQKYSSWGSSHKARNGYQIKAFLNWLFNEGVITFSGNRVIPRIEFRRKSSVRSYYTSEEISKFMNTFDIDTAQKKEEYLIICFIVYLGLRISDVIHMKLSSIDFHSRTISIIQYKTGNPLSLPLVDEMLIPLGDYLMNCRPADADLDYLFITGEQPYRLKEELQSHNYIVRSHLIRAGIDITNRKAGFHALRHSFATRQLENDTDIYAVSTMLGHTSVDVTDLYLDIDTSKLKKLALEVPNVLGI